MVTAPYLAWATDKKPKKEHVSFFNFVKKFDIITDKETAKKLDETSFKLFRERHENNFWDRRALNIADRRLLTNSATIAKETAVIAQKASIKESISRFERCQSDLRATEDSDDGENRLDVKKTYGWTVDCQGPIIAVASLSAQVILAIKQYLDPALIHGAPEEICSGCC